MKHLFLKLHKFKAKYRLYNLFWFLGINTWVVPARTYSSLHVLFRFRGFSYRWDYKFYKKIKRHYEIV